MNDSRLLEQMVVIAREAGDKILKVYQSDFAVTHKDDETPLTQADIAAHSHIVAALEDLSPRLPILSEEAANIPYSTRRHWQQYWLVDPLDGTREFIKRNGEFTVNIALIEEHAPMLGVVHVPVKDTVYTGSLAGTSGAGAFRQAGRETATAIHVRSPAATPLRIVGSRSHRGDTLDRYLPRLAPYDIIAVGSSLKFCLVAEGSADLYPRFGPTSEWDTAAAQAVVEAAGGAVIQTDGSPLRYNTKADLLNPHFLVYGDRARDWRKVLSP